MEINYGQGWEDVISSTTTWDTTTRDDKWKGLRHPRSSELKKVDRALAGFHLAPSVASYQMLRQRFIEWAGGKQRLVNGNIDSRRAWGANTLERQIQQMDATLVAQTHLKNNINNQLMNLNWKQHALCAELCEDIDVIGESLNNEANLSSGWAMKITPNPPINFWYQKGQDEATRLFGWPNLARTPRILMSSRGMQWPTSNNFRWGLYCHSSAALAVRTIVEFLGLILVGGHPIRSIDVIQQQPAQPGGMSHWWVCINKPTLAKFGNRYVRFSTVADFSCLPLCGGCVIDMWGALWEVQGRNPNQWVYDLNGANVGDAVRDVPWITLGEGNDAVKCFTHET